MAGSNNRQRKSCLGFMSVVFSMFKSNKNRGGYYDSYYDGIKARKLCHDEDVGRWVAEPAISMKDEAFITCRMGRVSVSESFEIGPAGTDA